MNSLKNTNWRIFTIALIFYKTLIDKIIENVLKKLQKHLYVQLLLKYVLNYAKTEEVLKWRCFPFHTV